MSNVKENYIMISSSNKKTENSSVQPLYLQVFNSLKNSITDGEYKDGDQLPSERALCDKFNVSRISIRKALDMLEREGIVYSVHGKGNFVRESKMNSDLHKISTFAETLSQKGYSGFTKILGFEEHCDNHSYDVMLDAMQSGTSSLQLLGYANGCPVVFYDSVIKWPLSNKIYEEAQTNVAAGKAFSTFDLCSEVGITIGKISQRILAAKAGNAVGKHLNIDPTDPVLVLESLIFDNNMIPFEYKRGYYRTDKYSFNIDRIV